MSDYQTKISRAAFEAARGNTSCVSGLPESASANMANAAMFAPTPEEAAFAACEAERLHNIPNTLVDDEAFVSNYSAALAELKTLLRQEMMLDDDDDDTAIVASIKAAKAALSANFLGGF